MTNYKLQMRNSKLITVAICILHFAFYILPCSAEITATVYPGYQFSANERPTAAQLNLLGRPTVLVSGTLGGTNVALAANSVTTTMMSDTLPGSNLVWGAGSPRVLVIADDGVTTNQLHSGVAGLGLSGGSGTALRVNVDTNTITITNDVVTLNLTTFSNLVNAVANVTNIVTFTVTNYVNTNQFSSYPYPLSSGLVVNTNHSLPRTPRNVRAVFVCQSADQGYVPTDEVDVQSVNGVLGQDTQSVTIGGNATNVFAIVSATAFGNLYFHHKTTGADAELDDTKWLLRIDAQP